MGITTGKITRCQLDYCSIKWSYIKLWKEELQYPTRLDKVGLAIVTIAYTTMRRVGTFLPASSRDAEKFSWITPNFIRLFEDTETMLIWIPKHKSDQMGKASS